MEKLEGYNSRIERLSELVAQLESGELSLDGLSEMETITRELHERSIILRYKAFKDQVMPEDESEDELDENGGVEVEVIIEELDEEEASASDGGSTDDQEEDQAIDFSIFDDEDTDSEEEPTFEPEPIPEPIEEEPIAVVEPEPVAEEKIEEVEEEIEETPEPEPIEEEEASASDEESEDNLPEAVSDSTQGMTAESFLDRLKIEGNLSENRFSAGKLDSLIGAFGLNQRLRYINDLFDGSSEVFSDAIKALDNQSNLGEANQKASQFASSYEWDPEEEIVIEFMSFVSRRYA